MNDCIFPKTTASPPNSKCDLLYLDASRRVLQTLDDLDHVGAGVLLGAVDAAQLDVRPVDEVAVDCDAEGVDGFFKYFLRFIRI